MLQDCNMSYGPHQVKMLNERRRKTSSHAYDYYKNSTYDVNDTDNHLNTVEVTESLLFDIRKRLKAQRSSRRLKIIIFVIGVATLLLFGLLWIINTWETFQF